MTISKSLFAPFKTRKFPALVMGFLTLSAGTLRAENLSEIQVHGHRGARARMPENTLPAFEYALKVGVDVLELDLGVSKDDVLVISHDSYINPAYCLDARGEKLKAPVLLRSLTLLEIKSYDCGSLPNPAFPRQTRIPQTRIPTLEELFSWISSSKIPGADKIRFNIETKIEEANPNETVEPKRFVELLAVTLGKFHFEGRVVMQSFDYRTLTEMKKILPQLPLSALTNGKFANSLAILHRTGAHYVSPTWMYVHSDYVRKIHDQGGLVLPWTANSPHQWAKLVAAGVDGIITDDPEGLIAFLKERGLRK